MSINKKEMIKNYYKCRKYLIFKNHKTLMREIILMSIFLSLVFLTGCVVTGCEEYCESQPHIQCVGYRNITGNYPNCTCAYTCYENGIS